MSSTLLGAVAARGQLARKFQRVAPVSELFFERGPNDESGSLCLWQVFAFLLSDGLCAASDGCRGCAVNSRRPAGRCCGSGAASAAGGFREADPGRSVEFSLQFCGPPRERDDEGQAVQGCAEERDSED